MIVDRFLDPIDRMIDLHIDSFIRLPTELPVFTKELNDASNTEGETVSLEVIIKNDSNCQMKWFKDGDAITEGGRITLVNRGEGRYSLVIHDAEERDSGQYSCVAQNENGKVTSTGKLSVEGKPSCSSKGLFTGREEDPNTRKILEGRSS